MRTDRLVRWLFALLLLVCVTVPLHAAAGESADATPASRLMTLFSELADAVAGADAERCDQVAGSLTQWTNAHATELGELSLSVPAYLETLPAGELETLDRELVAHFEIIIGAAVVCGSHDATMDALDAMEAAMSGRAAEAP